MSKKKSGKRSNIIASVNPQVLASEYSRSVQTNPHLHNPGLVHGTASADHIRRDFLTWCGGYESGLKQGQQSTQQGQQQTQFQTNQPSIGLFGSGQQPQQQQQQFGQQSSRQSNQPFQVKPLPPNLTQALQSIIQMYASQYAMSAVA